MKFFNSSYLILMLFILSLKTFAAPDLYKVVYKKGTIKMKRGDQQREVFKGDFLLAGDIIETKAKSLLILGFGESYRSRMKVGPLGSLTLEGKQLDKDDNSEEKTFFFLKVGNILVNYINKNKDKNRLKVRTKNASMGIRGTEFFINTTEAQETLVAVKSGVVLAKHNSKKTGVPLSSEEGVVFTSDGASEMLTPPKWYKHINWNLDSTTKDIEKLFHGEGIRKVGVDSLVSKMISVKGDSLKNSKLKGETKDFQKKCDADDSAACNDLALYLLKHGQISETKNVVMGLFNKACGLGDVRSCVWVGRVEYEHGDREQALSHMSKLCEDKKSAYSCYSLWEVHKADRIGIEEESEKKANYYLEKSLSILHGLDDFEGSLTVFEDACNTENGTACLNLGILLEQVDKKFKAQKMYEKGCAAGSGASCSNLGYMLQAQKKLPEAKKQYTKACFMDEAYGCYNLSCIYSKENKIDLSKQYLRMAISGGFNDWSTIKEDQDLKNLKADSSYAKFATDLKTEFSSEGPESKAESESK